MTETPKFQLDSVPVHLGLGATVVRQPPFTGAMEWYETYAQATAADGRDGRLVTMHSFSAPWDSWEVHPHGDELVVCVQGTMTLHQEIDGGVRTVTVESGEAVINPAGVWHTADVMGSATALFITAGLGTDHRPR